MSTFSIKQCSRSSFSIGFCFVFLLGKAQFNSIHFRHLTTAQGLSNSTIRSIAQDKYGFIWIGTLNGLNVFNGYSIKSFYKSVKPGGLPNLAVTALATDAKCNLWIGTRTTLCYYDYSSEKFVRCNKDSVAISQLTIADSIHLWAVTNKGVYLIDIQTKQWQAFRAKNFYGIRVTRIFQHNNGQTYFACNDGLRVYDTKSQFCKEYFFPQVSADTIVKDLAVDSKNNVWVSVGSEDNHLVKIGADLQTLEVMPQIPKADNNSSQSIINQIVIDKNDRLWFSTTANGFVSFPIFRTIQKYKVE